MEDIVVKVEPDEITSVGDQELFSSESSQSEIAINNNESNSNISISDFNSLNCENEEVTSDTNSNNLDEFCFETDHLALKANNDYKNLLKTISILEAQRCQAIKDLDRLHELQEEALTDPIGFVERLQRNEDMNIPSPQIVQSVPEIDWTKYSLNNNNTSAFGRRQLTRLSAKVAQDYTKNILKGKSNGANDQKTQKTHMHWSCEEQKRLEELLVQFPPEEVETRRWEKIANCLENRTPIQVASRVQKYFIKLMKAGIPIPGRMPSTVYLKKARRNIIRQQPSTFLVSHSLPVYMPEVEEDYSRKFNAPLSLSDSKDIKIEMSANEDDEEINPELRNSSEFNELKCLKKVLRDKLKTCGLAEHIGYKCALCKANPIIGVRWHCTVCKPPEAVDFCDDCMESKHEVGNHSSDHRLEELPNADSVIQESSYSNFMDNDYNYLDPNYMPVT
ncbi:ZZ-type zinc finger-containing protein 3 [Parasteatoda tepidariorum]|nr:ZZ-type zinc finger-containing protein 3 [Parasteatoda tepidariorum]